VSHSFAQKKAQPFLHQVYILRNLQNENIKIPHPEEIRAS
jgi:hypothetical protein